MADWCQLHRNSGQPQKALQPFVTEACTDLAHPAWSAVGTNTLTGGSAYFSDTDWASYPVRFYRLRSP